MLGVVGVSVARVIANEGRVDGVADVQNVQPSREGGGAHPVSAGRALVDDDVVGVAPSHVQRIRFDVLWWVGDGAELRQVDHLHPVAAGLRDDERVVVVDLDVAQD